MAAAEVRVQLTAKVIVDFCRRQRKSRFFGFGKQEKQINVFTIFLFFI